MSELQARILIELGESTLDFEQISRALAGVEGVKVVNVEPVKTLGLTTKEAAVAITLGIAANLSTDAFKAAVNTIAAFEGAKVTAVDAPIPYSAQPIDRPSGPR